MIHTLHDVGVDEAERRADGPPRNSVTTIADIVIDVHELGEEEDREPDAGVLGVEAADELLLGLDEVERRVVGLGGGGDEEDRRTARRRWQPGSSRATIDAVLPAGDDAVRRERARLEQHADDREPERGLVADQLRRRAHRAEQRVLRARRPAGEHHAVDARCPTSRGRTGCRSAGRRAAGTSGGRDATTPSLPSRSRRRSGRRRTRGTPARSTRYGASRNTMRSAAVGDRLLLEEQLDAVGERLQHAERTGLVRARCGSACRR